MADIIENEEVDRDTVDADDLEQLFNKEYKLMTETAVRLNKSFINKLSGTKSSKLAISLTDNTIEIHQLTNASLSLVCRLSGHKKNLTEVVWSPNEDHLLYSAGEDGLVKLWDTRSGGTCVQEYKDENELIIRPYGCMDVSWNGRVVCAGSMLVEDDAYLVFWDQRQVKPMGGYWNSHTDDITQVTFHKQKTEVLASGSLDGLLNVYNVLERTEDDALTYSLNVENSVAKLSWLDDKQLSCITQSDDLQVWDTENGDMVKSYSRDKVARSIKRSRSDDCYLVDTYTSADGSQVLLAGSNDGIGEVLRSVSLTGKKLQPRTNFKNNKQIVRCCWYCKDRDILVTTGESGLISVWSGATGSENEVTSKKLTKSLNKLHVNRHKPY